MLKTLAVLCTIASLPAFAADKPVDMSREPGFAKKVEDFAAAYDLKQQLAKFQTDKHAAARAALGLVQDADQRNCDDDRPGRPPSPGCVDAVCKMLGTFGCDEMSEIQRVGEICRGNNNSECLTAVCKRLGTFGCDELSEITEVAGICRGHWGSRCMDYVCTKLGTFGCDERSEIARVGGICSGVRDTGCIDSVCKRLGTFGCDELSELETVANSCK